MLWLKVLFLVSMGIAVGGLVWLAFKVPMHPRPRLGHRGAQRELAARQGGLFSLVEPLVRFVAGILSLLQLGKFRARREQELRRSSYPLGLTADEYIAFQLLAALALGCVAVWLCGLLNKGPGWVLAATAYGFVLPLLQVREVIRSRGKQISRSLPHAMEITAMCMGAGLDFPGALRLLSHGTDPLSHEFRLILEELDLGHTRREALLAFAERAPVPAVQDFVRSVVQAEQKGSPLAKVIQVQGRALNARRSVLAEEAAARAGIMMIGPMMMLLACIGLLLVGPFLVRGIGF